MRPFSTQQPLTPCGAHPDVITALLPVGGRLGWNPALKAQGAPIGGTPSTHDVARAPNGLLYFAQSGLTSQHLRSSGHPADTFLGVRNLIARPSLTWVSVFSLAGLPSSNTSVFSEYTSGGGDVGAVYVNTDGSVSVVRSGSPTISSAAGIVGAGTHTVAVAVMSPTGSSTSNTELYVNGVLVASETGVAHYARYQLIGPREVSSPLHGQSTAMVHGVALLLGSGWARHIHKNPWRIFTDTGVEVTKLVSPPPAFHALTGANAESASATSTGTLTQAHVLAGADAASSSTASAAALVQTHALAGADAESAGAASTAALTQTHILAGASAISASAASTGAISLTADLIGANAESASAASAGALTQTHVLIGVNAESASEASAWVLVQVQTLSGANAVAAAEAGTGAVRGAETILEGANAEAASEASTGSIHTFEVSPSFAADFVVDFATAAKGVLTDRAVWRSADGSAAALDGFFDQEFDSDLNSRAQPARYQFAIFEGDDPGVAIGDSLVVGGVEYAVAHRQVDRAVGEIILQLQRA